MDINVTPELTQASVDRENAGIQQVLINHFQQRAVYLGAENDLLKQRVSELETQVSALQSSVEEGPPTETKKR